MGTKKVFFNSGKNKKLAGMLHIPGGNHGKTGAVILSHGFAGDKEDLEESANRLCLKGLAVLRFDFSGCGESYGKFEDVTVSQYINDLMGAVKFVLSLKYVDSQRIGLAGISLGGTISLICASRLKKIRAVSPAAPITDFRELWELAERRMKVGIDEWKKKGYFYYMNGLMPKKIKYSFYKDSIKYDMKKIARKISCPVLIIHGNNDDIVPLHQSRNIINYLKQPKKLIILDGVDHAFSSPKQREALMNLIENWFEKWLKDGQKDA